MRIRPSWNVVGLLFIAVAAAAAQGAQSPNVSNLGKKEWAVLVVEMHNGKCKLKEKQTSEFRTEAQSEVSWIVVGHCSPVNGAAQRISIDPGSFTKANTTAKFNPFDMNNSVFEVDVPVSAYGPYSRIIGKIKPQSEIPATVKGHYKYKIKINKMDAEHRSPADEGDFFLCPVWPCEL